ncbi:hypothetical protein SCP_1403710 [Sparassis crispa]|uniref:Uncharacterized protein n=1 Tax=Sparassis crispa TaxID=139825 RepID=A0A401H3H8_9APHY|nr:hypothetical protein SCP_1403710 [Sparassis crispa]GBE88963.1 hypothetical protein SCP_1403710 [Sparassis crispa]
MAISPVYEAVYLHIVVQTSTSEHHLHAPPVPTDPREIEHHSHRQARPLIVVEPGHHLAADTPPLSHVSVKMIRAKPPSRLQFCLYAVHIPSMGPIPTHRETRYGSLYIDHVPASRRTFVEYLAHTDPEMIIMDASSTTHRPYHDRGAQRKSARRRIFWRAPQTWRPDAARAQCYVMQGDAL